MRQVRKLNTFAIRDATKPGLYDDGVGLYLHVGPSGGKSWIFRYMRNGKACEMGWALFTRSPWPKRASGRPSNAASLDRDITDLWRQAGPTIPLPTPRQIENLAWDLYAYAPQRIDGEGATKRDCAHCH